MSTEEGPSPKIYFGLSLFISISMSNRLFFIILIIMQIPTLLCVQTVHTLLVRISKVR